MQTEPISDINQDQISQELGIVIDRRNIHILNIDEYLYGMVKVQANSCDMVTERLDI